jgi:hypothetical protein
MKQQHDLSAWDEFEEFIRKPTTDESGKLQSELLFRGQSNSEWKLETTLERAGTKIQTLMDYFQFLAAAKPQLETFTGQRWSEISLELIRETYKNYSNFSLMPFPAYELCVYSRHHGFPSMLLDWSRSPYVAAYFAFQQPVAEKVAIWVYRQYTEGFTVDSSTEPRIKNLGPYVTSHPRHYLQQGQYTLAAKFENSEWHLKSHNEVFALGRKGQDEIVKLTLPGSEREGVLKKLDFYNINAYSLLQTEDALVQTITSRLLPRYK